MPGGRINGDNGGNYTPKPSSRITLLTGENRMKIRYVVKFDRQTDLIDRQTDRGRVLSFYNM